MKRLAYNFKKGDKVLVYGVELDGEPATIDTINQAGNVLVRYDQVQYSEDWDTGERIPFSGQLVHPKQLELNLPKNVENDCRDNK